MSERERYPPGVPCWVDTLQPDPRAALDFYGAVFEWEFTGPGPMPGDPPGQYFIARVNGRDVAGIGSRPRNGPAGATWNTYIRVASADEAVAAARRAGGSVLQPPFDVPPAGRTAVLADPAGAPFCVWEARTREGAQLVNEPRTWSMSSLHTPDPEGAKAFYGAVFGWRPDVFDAGEVQFTLWRLPGYVGGEPEQPVPRDVVAVMAPAAPTQRGTRPPPHWSVDFWVAGADALAERAARLGGKVIVPPHATPGFRTAVLADPQGATFWIDELVAPPPRR
jgi:predicted enzyme related to lactoylglutathione lyase